MVNHLLYRSPFYPIFFFFSSRRRHTRYWRDWSSDVCSSDLFPCAYSGARDLEFSVLGLPAPHSAACAIGGVRVSPPPCPSPGSKLLLLASGLDRKSVV